MRDTHKVCLATITAPHGIRGEVRIHAHGNVETLQDYPVLEDAHGKPFTITWKSIKGTVWRAAIKGVTDRNTAETLRGTDLYIDRTALPEEADDTYYYHDLVGLAVHNPAGETIGTVTVVDNFGAGDVLEFRRRDGTTMMIPFTATYVPEIAMKDGHIVVDAAYVETDDK